jgi:hypothetical protein
MFLMDNIYLKNKIVFGIGVRLKNGQGCCRATTAVALVTSVNPVNGSVTSPEPRPKARRRLQQCKKPQ